MLHQRLGPEQLSQELVDDYEQWRGPTTENMV